ncbi:MAG: hypothetical protein NC082_07620 [Clostridiales bacterium]|nr:hypothetical protein [Clostridiales bacterium]
MIKSETITISPATYARAAMSKLAARRWWIAVIPMTLFGIASFWDKAYIVAALIWLLMLLPPALMMAYYSYLLKPEAAAMSRPHHVIINPDRSITIQFDNPDEESDLSIAEMTLDGKNIENIIERNTHIELSYNNSPLQLLIIPFESLPIGSAARALSHLYGD